MKVSRTAAACLSVLCLCAVSSAKSVKDVHGFEPHFVMPPDMGMVSIKSFGAVGDGKTDDTEAFKKAFCGDDPRRVYFPNGTYLVKESLIYGINAGKKKRTTFIGESASKTIIKLADNSPGFGDAAKPKVFIATRPPKQQGEQNMFQYLYHLTIEIGKGNPGAIALSYHSNNTGAIKDVVIRASDPSSPGAIGLACQDWEVGPANARYLTVDGFDTGIALTRAGNYFTMEHVTVRNCKTGVIAPTTTIRDLATENCATPVRVTGMCVLVDAVLKGSGPAAIDAAKGSLFARNIKTQGYAKAIASPKGDAAGPAVEEYVSDKVAYNFEPADGMKTSLNLPVEESPELQYPQSNDEWVAIKGNDITDDLQKAIDGGAKHIYIAGGGTISKTIHIRNNVERIASVGVASMNYKTGDQPAWRLEAGNAKVVLCELLYGGYGGSTKVQYEQAAPRTWVIRHSSGRYETAPEGAGGKLFMESICGNILVRKVNAYLRDMDTEQGGPNALCLTNEGGVMWVLGQKTEDFATKIKTVDGFTELLGGTFRQNWTDGDFQRSGLDIKNPPPLFEAINSNVSYTYVSWGPAVPFNTLVREKRGEETKNLDRKAAGGGAALFVGYTKRAPAK
jgi:hypothetical protein